MAVTINTAPTRSVINAPDFNVTTSLVESSTVNNPRVRATMVIGGLGVQAVMEQPKGLDDWDFKQLLKPYIGMPDFAKGGSELHQQPVLSAELLTEWFSYGSFATFATSGREISEALSTSSASPRAATSNLIGTYAIGDVLIIGFEEDYVDTGDNSLVAKIEATGTPALAIPSWNDIALAASKMKVFVCTEEIVNARLVIGNEIGPIEFAGTWTIKKITDFINDPALYFTVTFQDVYEDADGVCVVGTGVQSDSYCYVPAEDQDGETFGADYLMAKGNISDWYLASLDELQEMHDVLHAEGVGGFEDNFYHASSEYDATDSYTINFSNGVAYNMPKGGTRYIRPIRSFTAPIGTYELRGTGPGGGPIFYIDGTTYYEAAENDLPGTLDPGGTPWSNVIDEAIETTFTDIGTGQINTTFIIDQDGHTGSAAKLCDEYVVTDVSTKFLNKSVRAGIKYHIGYGHEMRIMYASDETYVEAVETNHGESSMVLCAGYGFVVLNDAIIDTAATSTEILMQTTRSSADVQISETLTVIQTAKCIADFAAVLFYGDLGVEVLVCIGETDKTLNTAKDFYEDENRVRKPLRAHRRTQLLMRTGWMDAAQAQVLNELLSTVLPVYLFDQSLTAGWRVVSVITKEAQIKARNELVSNEITVEYHE